MCALVQATFHKGTVNGLPAGGVEWCADKAWCSSEKTDRNDIYIMYNYIAMFRREKTAMTEARYKLQTP